MNSALENFQDWGRALETMKEIEKKLETVKEIEKKKVSQQYQTALIRMLKYRSNWRLREAALESISVIKDPTPPLLSETLDIIMDDNLYFEARALACRVMSKLIENCKESPGGCRKLTKLPIAKQLRKLAAVPQPPILLEAVSGCLSILGDLADEKQRSAARISG